MEAFVYCWTDHRENKLYVGWHKGDDNDGYISSSTYFMSEYNSRPESFSRQIIAHGTASDMQKLERVILESVNAAKNPDYYNRHNGGNGFMCIGHSELTRKKMSATWKAKEQYNCVPAKAQEAWMKIGKHSDRTRRKMAESQRRHSKTRSAYMKSNNPMKNPETVKKMLEARRHNKGVA